MALNKKERLELDRLTAERDAARALSWPNFDAPKPLPIPPFNEVSGGWSFNLYTKRVYPAWNRGRVGFTSDPRNPGVCGSHQCQIIYATEREAWLALYHAAAMEYGANLARMLNEANAAPEADA